MQRNRETGRHNMEKDRKRDKMLRQRVRETGIDGFRDID
jgi:hypothetical protein